MPSIGGFGINFLEKVLDDGLFVALGRAVHPTVVAVFKVIALVNEQGCIAAVVDDKLRTLAAGEAERLIRTPPILFEGLALPRENGNSRRRDCRRSVILRGEDIATRPSDIGSEIHEGLDQNGCLNGHVQGACDSNSGKRF